VLPFIFIFECVTNIDIDGSVHMRCIVRLYLIYVSHYWYYYYVAMSFDSRTTWCNIHYISYCMCNTYHVDKSYQL